jgi:ATPase subunit of ABC transporter with duplicated ATPase domains
VGIVCALPHTRRICLQGNYDQFIKTQIEQMENNAKRYNWEQNQLQHMKVLVRARAGAANIDPGLHCALWSRE